jgi:transposase
MALLRMIMMCLLVYTVLKYHIRTALKDHVATFPNQKGNHFKLDRMLGLSVFCRDSPAVHH